MADAVAAVAEVAEGVVAEAVDGAILPAAEEVVGASSHLPLTLALALEVASMVRLMSSVALAYSQRIFIVRRSFAFQCQGYCFVMIFFQSHFISH